MRIKLLIDTPTPEREAKPSIEERVDEALELIDSDAESIAEWNFIKNLNNRLCKCKKLSPKAKKILEKIQPILHKHRDANSEGEIDLKPEIHPTVTRVSDKEST